VRRLPAIGAVAAQIPLCGHRRRGCRGGDGGGDRHRQRAATGRRSCAGAVDPDQGRLRSHPRSRLRRLRDGGHSHRRQEHRGGAAEHQRPECGGHRRRTHDRDAWLRRHPPAHVAGHPAQRAAGRLAGGLPRRGAAYLRREVHARRRLCRQPVQRVGRHRQRGDLHPRLVPHPQQPRPLRRRRQGAVRLRRARGLRLRQRPQRNRALLGNRDQQVPRRHRAPAQAVFFERRPVGDGRCGSAATPATPMRRNS
jgi:hypothetical protein